MSKSSLLKTARNYAEYLRKKARGPVKTFFHITKNERVPSIEQQGLLTNSANANINSANQPFAKHGISGGGVWVTTEPTAFPVYGTTIGGKGGNAEARADALSTIKIEIPLPELAKMRAVQDPYGKNILRKGDDPKAIEPFMTWAGIKTPTTVLLDDVKPQWLKNIGYVEDTGAAVPAASRKSIDPNLIYWYPSIIKGLNKADRQALTGLTGADRKLVKQGIPQFINIDKSPSLPVREQIFKNLPIKDRLPVFPAPRSAGDMAELQGISGSQLPVANTKRVTNTPTAHDWTEDYRDYVKPGQSGERTRKFAPGAISRGIGNAPYVIKARHFDWPLYKDFIKNGATPAQAAAQARPVYKLDWDNIVYNAEFGYGPKNVDIEGPAYEGAISRGKDLKANSLGIFNSTLRREVVDYIKSEKNMAADYLRTSLGREPTSEEIDNWARIGVFDRYNAGDIVAGPFKLSLIKGWANSYDKAIIDRLTHELGGN